MNAIFLLALAFAPGDASPLTCATPVIDLGATRGGPTLTQTFDLLNRSDGELTILHVQPSCGCLVTRLTTQTLKPGASAAMQVQIGTVSQPEGDNLWTLRLFYRTAGSNVDRLLDLQVKAKLAREVSLQPAAARLSGKPGLTHEFTLTDRRAKPMPITAVAASSNHLAVLDDTDWHAAEGGWVRTIRVRITADCPAGKSEEIVQIVSSDPDYRDLRVPVTVNRTDKLRYQVAPGEVRLETGPAAAETRVLIRDVNGQPLEIDSVEADDPALTCRAPEGSQATAVVSVAVRGNQTPQRWSNVRMHVRAPMAQTIVVPVSCPGGK